MAKATAVLDSLAQRGEATPAQLAELAGEPRSTIHRLLSTLEELDLVEPGRRRGTCMLGFKLFQLGTTVVSRFDERQAALPVMERIHEDIGETTFLCIRRGDEGVCIERLDGKQVNLRTLSLGGSLPLHAGSAPRALLAFAPPAAWDDYLQRADPQAFTAKPFAIPDAVIEELHATRDRGYAISDQDITPGVASLGAPIFDHAGAVRAALSIGGLRDPILGPGSRALELLRNGATEISRTLDHMEESAAGCRRQGRHPPRAWRAVG
ncbi:MAG: IclR family transcriptional regulator [Solirubrobacteraceae bacterium]